MLFSGTFMAEVEWINNMETAGRCFFYLVTRPLRLDLTNVLFLLQVKENVKDMHPTPTENLFCLQLHLFSILYCNT